MTPGALPHVFVHPAGYFSAHEQGAANFAMFLAARRHSLGTSTVETLEGSDVVTLHFSNGATVDLAPDEQAAAYIGSIVELRLGPELSVEFRPEPGPGPGLT
jgi:hypothetical protein